MKKKENRVYKIEKQATRGRDMRESSAGLELSVHALRLSLAAPFLIFSDFLKSLKLPHPFETLIWGLSWYACALLVDNNSGQLETYLFSLFHHDDTRFIHNTHAQIN